MDRVAVMARSLVRDRVAVEVTSSLAAAGVRCILLKGAAIATWLYDDGALRWYSDTDLLVAPADFRTAETELRRLGFGPARVGWSPHELSRHAHPWTRGQETIDLHHHLWGVRVAPAEAWSILTRDTERLRVGGGTVEVLSLSARVLHVALHAVQDGPQLTKAREDLMRAATRVSEDTWREAAELARALGAAELMAAGLRADPATAPLCERLGLRDPSSPLARLLAAGDPPQLALALADALAVESWQLRLSVATRLAVPTTAWMRARYPLARYGRAALAACYARRVATALWHAPAAIGAIARAWR